MIDRITSFPTTPPRSRPVRQEDTVQPHETVTLSGGVAKADRMPDLGRHDVSGQVVGRSGLGTTGAVIAGLNLMLIGAALVNKALDR